VVKQRVALSFLAIAALGTPTLPAAAQDSPVAALATEYVNALLERTPELATQRGIPSARHDRLSDNSLGSLHRWRRREDAWLARLHVLNAPSPGNADWATYRILREALEASVVQRVCRFELWGVNSLFGWQASYPALARSQPVGSDPLRKQALARWRSMPGRVNVEIGNLREGLRRGYAAPRPVVENVIRQLDGLLEPTPDASPLASPAQRDSSAGFRREFVAVVAERINPAVRRYREFLAAEYLPRTRTSIAASESPGGPACYRASVRRYTTLDIPADSIFAVGQREVARLEAAMGELGQRIAGTQDVPTLLRRLVTDTAFTFRTREEIVDSSRAAVARAERAVPAWFGLLPQAAVVIEQHPEFRQRAGAVAQYSAAAEDGSRPGIFYINTFAPETQSRARIESTAFHEGIPGHHFQVTIAQERATAHPIARYTFNSGYGEGWALYAETVAGEMDLYSSDIGRLGLLASQAFRAVRLVLDAGIHAKGWTRAQAVEYLTAHSVVSPRIVQGEVDRYISVPGQASAYMLGNLEIRALRSEAERRLGNRFDIREFHDRVLEDGSLPLPALREKLEAWMAARQR
jgi:uncharacterized protein (DUF885 family)